MAVVITIEELTSTLNAVGAVEAVKAFKGRVIPSRYLREFTDDVVPTVAMNPVAALFLALWPETPAAVIEQLAEAAPGPEVVLALAKHPRTSPYAMRKLLATGDPALQVQLANSSRLGPELAENLLTSPDPEVRGKLAINPGSPPALQAKLAQDPVPFVRTALLRRSRLDAGVLTLLLHDDDLLVRAAAVTGATVDDSVLLEWADSDDYYIQLFLLQRAELPAKVMESLCLSRNAAIQELILARRPALSPDEAHGLSEHECAAVRALVAAKGQLPKAVQERLAADTAPEVSQALAANPAISTDTLWALLDTGTPAVRHALAENPALNEEQVLELCDLATQDLELAKRLVLRPRLTDEQKTLLLETGGETLAYHFAANRVAFPELDEQWAERWAGHAVPLLRAFAAGSHHLPRAALAKLAIDPNPIVRRALATNTALPERSAGFLVTDADPETATLARKRLDDIATAAQAPAATAPLPAEPNVKQTLKRIIKRAIRRDTT